MAAEVRKEIELEIAHVLFIDIVAYSKMAIDDQRSAIEQLNQIVQSTDEFRKAESENRLLKIPTGDGMALVFYRSPEAPVECALEISRQLKEHPRLKLRMGVHSGPVSGVVDVNGRVNVAGEGINMAQRVMDCGEAGHILLSKRVADDLHQFSHWRPHLYELGECEVKHGEKISMVNLFTAELGNSDRPRRLSKLPEKSDAVPVSVQRPRSRKKALIFLICAFIAAVAVASFLFWHRQKAQTYASAPGVPEKSIAVLPFENLSSDKENAYFADGIQDEILTRLAKIADLKVISRTSTQHYKSTPENLPEIAKQLGVAHIVEGSVQKSGDSVRVNVQLIKAANDSHLWADTFDRKLTDIFSVETEVAKAIADQLRAKITGREEQVIDAKPTDNVEAYDAYLRGLAYTLKAGNTTVNVLAAQKYFREAVRLDPKFAISWALLSIVDARGYISLSLQPTIALREEARQAVETALTLQPNLGEAILAKSQYHYGCLKDFDAAERYLEQARQFLPNSSRIPESLAYVTRRRGQWDRSESYFNEAERLDPRNVNLLNQHALLYIARRRFQEATRKIDQVLDITPDDVDAMTLKATIAQAEGDLPRASELLAPLHPTPGDFALETQVHQAILERRPAQIIPQLKEILARPNPALGFLNGELRFLLGWAQEVAGDQASAQETWRLARSELESFFKDQPENSQLIGDLALTNMGLGDKTAALALIDRATAVNPIEKDALGGPFPIEILARLSARTGDSDRAIAALQKLLSIQYRGPPFWGSPITPALLRLDPMFDPLRNDARFQKLVAETAPK
jgi:TolB-like protein/class 3 adenylate cyclase/Flp pilus assembly protein TadD